MQAKVSDGRQAGPIFVPFALPGETVRVEIIEERSTFARARMVEILEPAPERIAPRCPHHFNLAAVNRLQAACGGCQLQHLAYPAQTALQAPGRRGPVYPGWAASPSRSPAYPALAGRVQLPQSRPIRAYTLRRARLSRRQLACHYTHP